MPAQPIRLDSRLRGNDGEGPRVWQGQAAGMTERGRDGGGGPRGWQGWAAGMAGVGRGNDGP